MKCLEQPWVYDAATAEADTLAAAAADVLQNESAVRETIRKASAVMRDRCMEDVEAAAAKIRNKK